MDTTKRSFVLVAVLACVAWLAARPAAAAEAEPAPQRSTLRVPAKEWKSLPVWQKAPAGPGEFAPYPYLSYSPRAVRVDGRLVTGTAMGLLRSVGKDRWEIVPSLYGHAVGVVAVSRGLLWVQEGTRHIARGVVKSCLLGLSPKDLAVEKRLPDIRGGCIAVEEAGFWCLDELTTYRGPTPAAGRGRSLPPSGMKALTEYDKKGKGRRRFRADGRTLPKGLIQWAAVDPDAVWLSVLVPSVLSPSGHYGGKMLLVRLDRATGQSKDVELQVWRRSSFVSLPDRILWLMFALPSGHWAVHQLDKKTLKPSVLGKVAAPYAYALSTDGKNLWVFSQRGPHVFSLDGLRPVPLAEAGDPPLDSPGGRWLPASFRRSLSGSINGSIWAAAGQTLWLLGPDLRLIELRDEGSASIRDLSPFTKTPGERCQLTALPGVAYVHADGLVLRIESGKEEATALRLATPKLGVLTCFLATSRRLWARTSYRFNGTPFRVETLAISPELSQVRRIGLDANTMFDFANAVALADSLYVPQTYGGKLTRIDGASGAVSAIDIPKGQKKRARVLSLFALPDGRIACQILVSGYSLHVHDPASGRWKQADPSAYAWPVAVGGRLYGLARDQTGGYDLAVWRGDGWHVLGRQRLAFVSHATIGSFRTAGTRRHLYVRTALGLCRVPWSEQAILQQQAGNLRE